MSVLLPVLCDKVLADKVPPQPGVLAAYGPLLAVLTPEQLQDKLLPAASRAMRRTPEPAITALAGALQHVQLDLSSSALELSGLLLQQLRAKEAVRRVAGQALSALASRVRDAGVALQLVQSVSSVLDGSKEGKVKVAGERAALAHALTALAPLPAGVQGMEQPAAAVAAFCGTYYKEEREHDQQLGAQGARLQASGPNIKCSDAVGSRGVGACNCSASTCASSMHLFACTCSYCQKPTQVLRCLPASRRMFLAVCHPAAVEEVKVALLSCLAAWLPRCSLAPPPAAALLAAALAEPKEGLRKAGLAAAGDVLRAAPGLAGQLGSLAAPLAKIVAEGVAKAVARANGIAALQLAAQIAAADAAAGTTQGSHCIAFLWMVMSCHVVQLAVAPCTVCNGACIQSLVPGCGLHEAACFQQYCSCILVWAPAVQDPPAFCLCCLLCTNAHLAGAVLDKAGVWTTALAADSPLLSAATLAKLPPADAVPAAELAHTLLAHHRKRLQPGEA